MFPIRDHNPSGKIPFVTYALIAINAVVFFSYWGQMDDFNYISTIFDTFGFTPLNLKAEGQTLGLFTSMYLHGSFMHLAGNLLFLWIFGDNMEEEFGHVGFFLFYSVSGVVATLAHYWAFPYSDIPLVGASGAIAGVMGGYLLLFPKAKVDVLLIMVIYFRIFTIRAWIVLGVWLGIQLLYSVIAANIDGVAYFAHAGGFFAGFALTLPVWLRRGAKDYWQTNEGHPPHPETQYRWQNSRIPIVRRGQKSGFRIPVIKRKK